MSTLGAFPGGFASGSASTLRLDLPPGPRETLGRGPDGVAESDEQQVHDREEMGEPAGQSWNGVKDGPQQHGLFDERSIVEHLQRIHDRDQREREGQSGLDR